MKRLLLILIILTGLQPARAASLAQFTDRADAFLASYVEEGNVAYRIIKDDMVEINALYELIGTVDISQADDTERKAFYINAYNLIVIRQIATYYPMKSALDQNGFFDKVKHKVAGESLTLDQIEKGKVILKYRDPRVHFAFSCAAKGCPPLANFAFRADKLEQQLEVRTRFALRDMRFVRFNLDRGTVLLSKIFEWYHKDFTQTEESVIAYINKYRNKEVPAHFEIEYFAYDWGLNELVQ